MSLFDDDYSTFTFTYRCNGKDVTINLSKHDATVTDLLDEFMNFMKACGYCFDIDDRLDVVNDFKHDEAYDTMINDEEAEARAYNQAADGSVTFKTQEVPNSWVEYDANGKEQHFSSIPGFNYKPEDY